MAMCTQVHVRCLRQDSYQKLNVKFKNIQVHFLKNISGTSSAHIIYNTINRAISSLENVKNGYYLKIGKYSVLLRANVIHCTSHHCIEIFRNDTARCYGTVYCDV